MSEAIIGEVKAGLKLDLEGLLRTLPEGVCLCDGEGHVLLANKAFMDLVDAKADALVGKSAIGVFKPESRQTLKDAWLELETKRTVKGVEVECMSSNGSVRVLVSLSLLKSSEEDKQLILVSVRDLGRERSLVAELSRTQSESESLLVELDEAYRKLRSTQDELVRRERLAASGELAASVAHEIRNPLSIIGMSIQYLHAKLSPGHAFRGFTSAIIKKVERLDKITTQLINYGRPKELELQARDLHRDFNQVLKLAHFKSRAQGVKIVRRFDRGLQKVTCDHDLLDEVFTNLVTNALEVMPNGGVLTVETQWDPEHQQAVIQIADTGHGVSPKVKAQFFKPFFTTKRNGTGLGLAISHRIIDHHHGSITCTSKTRGTQRGTTFTIRLPLKPPATS
jgi:PAS domain S-box-containing protein